ncbi:CBS domain-containing protein [Nitrosomonas sp. Is37]|uniref:CBS domain-containing protein n=1 Tax=Nitrosomonas sp. Is37 TaxID=3080535 RepID=UPI00294AC5ED|nr:CBS domain-containing protein [Nitrosomonas sp. Is37]MDV6345263.1 CBS domain-containing protein [Nitrosomonas sp. Is37]
MKTVKQLLHKKGHEVTTIDHEASVYDAMQLMAANNIGSLVVMRDDKLAGILTERDFSRKSYLLDKPVKDMQVKEIMTHQVVYVGLDNTNEDCMSLITEMRVRHLPVIDEGKVIGIISIGDLVKDTISEHQFVIEQLERYIYETRVPSQGIRAS